MRPIDGGVVIAQRRPRAQTPERRELTLCDNEHGAAALTGS